MSKQKSTPNHNTLDCQRNRIRQRRQRVAHLRLVIASRNPYISEEYQPVLETSVQVLKKVGKVQGN